MAAELRLGRWQDALADVGTVDALITDPPYSERTHAGQRHGRRQTAAQYARGSGKTITTAGLDYAHMPPSDVRDFVAAWAPRVRGWICIFTSHDLIPVYQHCLEHAKRYVFAPIPCVIRGMNCRLAGDGPSNWTVWLLVARPRGGELWGTLPGAYIGTPADVERERADRIPGGKPLWLMRAVVRDYTRPGQLICDPFAGGGSTLLAARVEGRRSIGAELDATTHAHAAKLLGRPYTPDLFAGVV